MFNRFSIACIKKPPADELVMIPQLTELEHIHGQTFTSREYTKMEAEE